MATFSELVADVIGITKRPDLEDDVKRAIRVATLKAHHSDFYPRDLHESGIEWAVPAYIQSLEYRTVLPRFRALKFLRKYDTAAGDFFTVLTPEQILDDYGIERTNICYLSGEMLEIKSSTIDEHMIVGYYRHPVTTENGYTSWIALDHPDAIMYEAASKIFKQIGFDEQAAGMKQEMAEQFAILRSSNIQAVGY